MDSLHNTGDLLSPFSENRNNSHESVNLFKATVQPLCPSGPWELWATNESIQMMQYLYLDTLSKDSGRRKIRKNQQKRKFSLSIRPVYIHLNSCLLIYQVTLWFLTALLASLHLLPPQPCYADMISPSVVALSRWRNTPAQRRKETQGVSNIGLSASIP